MWSARTARTFHETSFFYFALKRAFETSNWRNYFSRNKFFFFRELRAISFLPFFKNLKLLRILTQVSEILKKLAVLCVFEGNFQLFHSPRSWCTTSSTHFFFCSTKFWLKAKTYSVTRFLHFAVKNLKFKTLKTLTTKYTTSSMQFSFCRQNLIES